MNGSRAPTLEEVLVLVKQLSPVEKVRLIERLAPEIERALAGEHLAPNTSFLGLVKDLGPAPDADEIDAARRDVWQFVSDDDT